MPPIHRPQVTAARFATAFPDSHARLADVLASGISPDELRAAVGRGLVRRVARGIYAMPHVAEYPDPWALREAAIDAHLALLRNVLADQPDGTYAWHETAAYVNGQATPRWSVPEFVSLVRPGAVNRRGPGFLLRGSGVRQADVIERNGVLATGLERTAIDLARGRRPEDAWVALDSAARARVAQLSSTHGNDLRRAVLDPALRAEVVHRLECAYRRCWGWPGTVVVRDHLDLVDPASESPLESRSRCWFWDSGMRHLRVGRPIASGGRTYFADFVDFGRKVIGEADGWGKYGTDLRAQRGAWDRERSRQGDLEADGYRFVRWTSTDTREAVVTRMRRALEVQT